RNVHHTETAAGLVIGDANIGAGNADHVIQMVTIHVDHGTAASAGAHGYVHKADAAHRQAAFVQQEVETVRCPTVVECDAVVRSGQGSPRDRGGQVTAAIIIAGNSDQVVAIATVDVHACIGAAILGQV